MISPSSYGGIARVLPLFFPSLSRGRLGLGIFLFQKILLKFKGPKPS